jgi:hypothetical protein
VVTGASRTNVHLYDMAGRPRDLPYDVRATMPVDIDGDGRHELVYATQFPFVGEMQGRAGLVIDRHGNELGRVRGEPGVLPRCKLLEQCPGEQIMTHEDGVIRIFGCPGAHDSDAAKTRYAHPYYDHCRRMNAVGYSWRNLGGL